MDYNIVLPSHAKVVSEEGDKGVYEIERLYPGYGNTLGNSIRRIILSSLPGAAVTRINIEGVTHEFSTLPGVLEDMMTIVLNFKQLRFRLHGDGPEEAVIDVKGEHEIKGKDVKCPTQLEVINTDHHLATITEKGVNFKVEITVEKGIGFVPTEELMKEKVPAGTMVIDAIFSPIRRANYDVENMRVGDRTDYNRLILTIETDGTISPREALKNSLEIMQKQIEQILIIDEHQEEDGSGEEVESVKLEQGADLKFSVRTKNALDAAGLKTPEELSAKTEKELLDLEGVGAKAVSEIKKALKKLNLSLKEE